MLWLAAADGAATVTIAIAASNAKMQITIFDLPNGVHLLTAV
jgi:hypothetical protein